MLIIFYLKRSILKFREESDIIILIIQENF